MRNDYGIVIRFLGTRKSEKGTLERKLMTIIILLIGVTHPRELKKDNEAKYTEVWRFRLFLISHYCTDSEVLSNVII